MFASLALTGLWLVGTLFAAYVAGVFTSQKFKDLLNGVPGATRNALKQVEVVAMASLHEAQAKVVTDLTGALTPKAPPAPPSPTGLAPPAPPAAS